MSTTHDAVKEALKKRLLGEDETKDVNVPKEQEILLDSEKAERPRVWWNGNDTFANVFGFAPVGIGLDNFPVNVFKSDDWSAEIAAFIPARTTFASYEIQKEACTKLVLALETNDKILITGPTGAGKSTLVECVCAYLGRPFVRINMTGDVESSSIFGAVGARDGATIWEDGPVTEGWKFGAVINIDEWEVTPPEIAMGFQRMLEDNGLLFLKEKPGVSSDKLLPPDTRSRLVFSGNTVGQGDESGQFAGTNVQNTAFLNRFQTVIILDYLDKSHESNLLHKQVPGLSQQTVDRMIKYAGLIRAAHRKAELGLVMSPRTMINWGRKIILYRDPKQALTTAYLDMLRESDRKIAVEFYTKVWGT